LIRSPYTTLDRISKDIRAFLDDHNDDPKPFVWTKSADEILDSLKRYCSAATGSSD